MFYQEFRIWTCVSRIVRFFLLSPQRICNHTLVLARLMSPSC
jgi:hypothetical protein